MLVTDAGATDSCSEISFVEAAPSPAIVKIALR
jgi:hypothetical protein